MADINKQIKRNILDKMKSTLDEYFSYNVDAKKIKKYFKEEKNFNNFLSDINNVDIEKFDSGKEYKEYIKKQLFDIIDDYSADQLDKSVKEKKKRKVQNFKEFIK